MAYRSNYPPYQGYGYGSYPSNSGPPPPPGGGYGGYGGGYGGYGAYGRPSAYNNTSYYGQQGYQGYQQGYNSHYGYQGGYPGQYQGGYGYQQPQQSGAVPGFTVPAPPQMPADPSGMAHHMNMQMQMEEMFRQKMAAMQIADIQPKARKRPDEEGFDPEEHESAEKEEMESLKSKMEDEDIMERLRCMYKDELLRRWAVSGTFEMTEGTIKPLVTYPEDDPAVLWYIENRGTDYSGQEWDPEVDFEYLNAAMDGLGTNEDAIIHLMVTRCNEQRSEIEKKFKVGLGKDLIKEIDSELSGNFRKVVKALFVPPACYDAYNVKKAIYGLGTDEAALIEIFLTRTNHQIEEMRAAYREVVNTKQRNSDSQIEEDIEEDTSGDFKRLLYSACQGGRDEISESKLDKAVIPIKVDGKATGMFEVDYKQLVNFERCQKEAMMLYEAGEDRWGTDDKTFNRIFSLRDYYSLRVIYDEYVKIAQRDIINSIDRETSGNFKKGLRAIAQNIKCRPMFFAELLEDAIKGAGTDDRALIRIIVSRSEIDMVQIKHCFLQRTKQTLWNYIKNDTSGDYKKLLLAIVGKN